MGKDEREAFWNASLEEIEASFLGEKSILDLPIYTSPLVPSSILLDKVCHMDKDGNLITRSISGCNKSTKQPID